MPVPVNVVVKVLAPAPDGKVMANIAGEGLVGKPLGWLVSRCYSLVAMQPMVEQFQLHPRLREGWSSDYQIFYNYYPVPEDAEELFTVAKPGDVIEVQAKAPVKKCRLIFIGVSGKEIYRFSGDEELFGKLLIDVVSKMYPMFPELFSAHITPGYNKPVRIVLNGQLLDELDYVHPLQLGDVVEVYI